ncbi:glycosyltransferase family 25 protein (plasmid) [Rhizobium sp. BG6]|uniref:glycosyltransferase family 25 protein n=1 Tax=Rhizobium sp. BG6 TaxID=2613771 RepID=UPI00193E4026|nr:glycosyltransferase family 25 protein [Rhizobium sp. BG6]QRM52383.1 glycosyltransferase family 25 protein [Rhizobium sp. BG6]
MQDRLSTQETQLGEATKLTATACGQTLPDSIAAYVINLDRSFDRWEHIQSEAERLGLVVERVAGVDASKVSLAEAPFYLHRAFVRANGRPMLQAEYGCYLAHMSAIRTFLASSADTAIIMEDDVSLQADLVERAAAILAAAPSADVVKLLNHRTVFHRSVARTSHGDDVGRCLFGPQGSAACYLVTRKGALRLLEKLERIELPYDIALERGWATGLDVYSVKDNVLHLSERSQESQIADRAKYRSIKLRGIRKIPTHIFRIIELTRRIKYALG